MVARKHILTIRWLALAAGPWIIMVVGFYLWWASLYLLAPLFLPFSAYAFSDGQWTVFSEDKLGWPINITYSAVIALAATWFGRRQSFWKAVALFAAIVVVASLALHGLMAALGYRFWYDSP